jgi:hypothetical protein
MAPLDDHEVTAFHLSHDPRERLVDERVQRWVIHKIVCYVYLQSFMRRDRRSECVENVGKGRERSLS